MDKYAKTLCKQNPSFQLSCQNPMCQELLTFKSEDVFCKDIYEFKCPKCGKSTSIKTAEFIDDFVKKMKKLGITID